MATVSQSSSHRPLAGGRVAGARGEESGAAEPSARVGEGGVITTGIQKGSAEPDKTQRHETQAALWADHHNRVDGLLNQQELPGG